MRPKNAPRPDKDQFEWAIGCWWQRLPRIWSARNTILRPRMRFRNNPLISNNNKKRTTRRRIVFNRMLQMMHHRIGDSSCRPYCNNGRHLRLIESNSMSRRRRPYERALRNNMLEETKGCRSDGTKTRFMRPTMSIKKVRYYCWHMVL